MLKLDQIDVSASRAARLCLEKDKALLSSVLIFLKLDIAYQFAGVQI